MAMTRTEWNALQAKLPSEDRMSYDEYRMALSAANKATPAPVATPAPTPAPTPVATPQQQAALVAQVVAAAIIKSPVVIDTPKNVAPDKTTVESIAREIAAVVAPVIAPSLPPATVAVLVKETTKAVVTNPEVKASDVGQSVDTKVAAVVAEKVSAATPVVNSIAAAIPVAGVVNTPRPAPTPTPSAPTMPPTMTAVTEPKVEPTPTKTTPELTSIRPSELAAQESGSIGAASIEAQIENNQDNGTETNTSPIKGPGDIRKFDETGTGFTAPTGPTGTPTGPVAPTGPTGTPTGPVAPKVYTASDGTEFTDQAAFVKYKEILSSQNADKASAAAQLRIDEENKRLERQSAYDLLFEQFKQYGLSDLVEPLKNLITSGASPSEFTIRLRESEPYKKRFAANAQRISKGLTALDEANYLAMEDQYQEVMRQYGLPESYYTKDATGRQPGFEQLLANDISNVELNDRLMAAQDRVLKANPEILNTLKNFYGDSITNGDILAYTLDPKNAIKDIQRKVSAAEIGAAQVGAGLQATKAGAEQLMANNVTGEQYQAAAPTISEASIRGGQLASIYKESPYTQQTAEQAVLNTPGSAAAIRQTKKLTALETAAFSGQSGRGVLSRERSGSI